jgi:dephospho-CoA kinase
MSYRIGLTGGIGSGKSTVAALFADLGVPVIDTDAISHQLTASGGKAISAIQSGFGDEFITPDGALDRARMRQLVFTDDKAKSRLEHILHPLILAESKSQAAASQAPYVLVVVPLLFESASYLDWLDRTLTVDCSEATQLARAAGRPGLDENIVRAIMSRQLSRDERLQRTDDVIHNDGNLDELIASVLQRHQQYLHLASTNN